MRRVYTKKNKSSVRKKALDQLRETRAQIHASHPELLESVKQIIQEQAQQNVHQPDEVKIDRKKNLEAVMMFLEMKKSYTPKFQSQIKDILREYQ